MSFLKDLQKNIKAHHFIALLGVLVLGLAIMQYSGRKTNYNDGFDGASNSPSNIQGSSSISTSAGLIQSGGNGTVGASEPVGQNEVYSNVPAGSMTSTYGLTPTPPQRDGNYDPSELLPKDVNSQWAQLNPAGNADFKNVNLLKAGYLIGIDTVGSTLRNANLQERSEPPNPTAAVSPWLNTTIEPDLMRLPLEIGTRGCTPQ
jgi:hypothetical protein